MCGHCMYYTEGCYRSLALFRKNLSVRELKVGIGIGTEIGSFGEPMFRDTLRIRPVNEFMIIAISSRVSPQEESRDWLLFGMTINLFTSFPCFHGEQTSVREYVGPSGLPEIILLIHWRQSVARKSPMTNGCGFPMNLSLSN